MEKPVRDGDHSALAPSAIPTASPRTHAATAAAAAAAAAAATATGASAVAAATPTLRRQTLRMCFNPKHHRRLIHIS